MGKNYAVNAVGMFCGGSLSVVWPEYAFYEFPVSKIAPDQDGDADKECNHFICLENFNAWEKFSEKRAKSRKFGDGA